jgi:CDP-diacylglycerol--serine O-phosphatidyltransferase
MKAIKSVIPHLFTLGNLALGVLSILFVYEVEPELAAYCIFLGAVLDFFDGFLARLLKVPSELGKQLDSLADMVTFGVAPGFLMMDLMELENLSAFTFILIPVFSAIRLAKFNIDEDQKTSFTGVPTPAVALTVACITLAYWHNETTIIAAWAENVTSLAFITVGLAVLLVAPFKMIALKFASKKLSDNWPKIVLVLSAIVLISLFKYSGGVYLFALYVFLSLLLNFAPAKAEVKNEE